MANELPRVGDPAPAFRAETTAGQTVDAQEYRGRRAMLLMFYPQDDTPGCTRQMCAARDEGAAYEAAGVDRFGVNDGTLASHHRFVEKYDLDFPLIVDPKAEIAGLFGVRKENGGTARATILIDRDGRIAYAAPGAHGAEEVLKALRADA